MKLKKSFKWLGLFLVLIAFTTFSSCAIILDTKAKLRIVNSSSYTVVYLYVYPSGSADEGPDQLGNNTITSGSEFLLTDIPEGTYDIKAVDQDNGYWQASNEYLAGGNTYCMTLYNTYSTFSQE